MVLNPPLPQHTVPRGGEFGDRSLEPRRGSVVHAGHEHHGGRGSCLIQPRLEICRTKTMAIEVLSLGHRRQPPES
jgi:hypothetical protein